MKKLLYDLVIAIVGGLIVAAILAVVGERFNLLGSMTLKEFSPALLVVLLVLTMAEVAALLRVLTKHVLVTEWQRRLAAMTLVASLPLTLLGVGWQVYDWLSPPGRTIVVIAEFSEGGSPEVPKERIVTQTLLEKLRDHFEPLISIHHYPKVILEEQTAKQVGREHKAALVVWGWYSRKPEESLVSPKFTFLRGPLLLKLPKEAVKVPPTDPGKFDFELEFSQELAALTSFIIGLIYYQDGSLSEAIDSFDLALTQLPPSGGRLGLDGERVYLFRGNCYGMLGKLEEARQQYQEALKIKSEYASPHIGLGNLYYIQDQAEQALEEYALALQLKAQGYNAAAAYANSGNIYLEQGKNTQARDAFEQAAQYMEGDPESAMLWLDIGRLYGEEGDTAKACTALQKAVRVPKAEQDVRNDAQSELERLKCPGTRQTRGREAGR